MLRVSIIAHCGRRFNVVIAPEEADCLNILFLHKGDRGHRRIGRILANLLFQQVSHSCIFGKEFFFKGTHFALLISILSVMHFH